MTDRDAALGLLDVPAIGDAEFSHLVDLIHRESGIYLGPAKRAMLTGRLVQRLRELGLDSFGAYCRHLALHRDELDHMLDRVCTNETAFFREPHQFDFLREHVLPAWRSEAQQLRRSWRVRAWSAGCSTGEEPYSLAMVLSDGLPSDEGWQIRIEATDLSRRALEHARTAIWPITRAQEIDPRYRKQYLLRGTGGQAGRMKIAPEIRSLVQFRRLNLSRDPCELSGPFDLILCRNVFIYFDAASRRRAIERLLDRLAPDGLLLLGHSESLHGLTERARAVAPTIYRLADASDPAPSIWSKRQPAGAGSAR